MVLKSRSPRAYSTRATPTEGGSLTRLGLEWANDVDYATKVEVGQRPTLRVKMALIRERYLKKTPTAIAVGVRKKTWRRPTFPLTSIIGAEELNGRVRNENGCDLFAIATK